MLMANSIKCRLPLGLLIGLSFLFLPFLSALSGAEQTARTYYQQALERINEGDTTGALSFLNKALELDPKHGQSLLARGRLYLEQANLKKARRDFTMATGDKDPAIKARAHIGLGDILRRMPYRNWQAMREYRLATKVDSTCREAYYAMSKTGFELGQTDGYSAADDALAKLICLDPEYKDAFIQWWEKILIQSDDELRKVGNCLEDFIANHPEKSSLLLYVAKIHHRLGESESSMITLDKLKTASPEHKRSERSLLEANCLLELDDTLGFENSYAEALKEAEKEGDFTRLFLEAETIFHPAEYKKWAALKTPAEKATFFRKFWKRRDPDPISSHNERLIEHYMRLGEAKKMYMELTPHSLFNTSYNYYRLNAPRAMDYNYDPNIWWDRSRQLALQQRGLLFVRHGEPDLVLRGEIGNPYEVWIYGAAYFPFGKYGGRYYPASFVGVGNVEKAMETESFKDPLKVLEQDFYGVDFKGQNGKLEIEFYQSLPVKDATLDSLEATIALYDTTWTELARNKSMSKKVKVGNDTVWFAVNKVSIEPGNYFFAVRMDVPGHRAVRRQSFNPSPYSKSGLDLSGIVLGSASADQQIHQRLGVDILPKPSLSFRQGEDIMVYFEVYNLKKDRQSKRSYSDNVTVTLLEEKVNIIKRLFRRGQPRTSLTLSFDRYPSKARGPFAEHFNIDTSELVPGRYQLQIEIRDNNRYIRKSKKVQLGFELAP